MRLRLENCSIIIIRFLFPWGQITRTSYGGFFAMPGGWLLAQSGCPPERKN